MTVNDGAADSLTYGENAVFKANMSPDATFAGWYGGDKFVSGSTTYSHVVTSSITLIAKAKVTVSLGIRYDDSGYDHSCGILVNGSKYEPNTSFDVILGESFSYSIVLGLLSETGDEKWSFDAWFDGDDVVEIGASGNLSPAEDMSYVAQVVSVPNTKTVSVTLKGEDEVTTIVAVNAISVLPEAETSSYDAGVYSFSFSGTKNIRITAVESIIVGGKTLAFDWFISNGRKISGLEYTFLLSKEAYVVRAVYSSSGTREIALTYGLGIDRTMGVFHIVNTDDAEGTISSDKLSAIIDRGKTITIHAEPKNGYKFDGWYAYHDLGGTPYLSGNTCVMTVLSNRVLYAKFVADPNAVYEWEGSKNNKSFEWRSKTYVFQRPLNPVCCRIDSEVYPVIELDVDMFSSPDSSPTSKIAMTNIASQDARRLPVRCSERYLQICVRNDREVDAVIVGTNMMEMS